MKTTTQPETWKAVSSELAAAVRNNMSTDAVAMLLTAVQALDAGNRPDTDRARAALHEVLWFADELREMLGVDEHNRLIDELGL